MAEPKQKPEHKWTNEELVSYMLALRKHLAGVQEAMRYLQQVPWLAEDNVARQDLNQANDHLADCVLSVKQCQYRVAAI